MQTMLYRADFNQEIKKELKNDPDFMHTII